jgi:hypothetical protein
MKKYKFNVNIFKNGVGYLFRNLTENQKINLLWTSKENISKIEIFNLTTKRIRIIKIKKCQRCNRKRAIYAKGICKSCYVSLMLKKNPNAKKNVTKWRKNHRDYWKGEIQNARMRRVMRKRAHTKLKNYKIKEKDNKKYREYIKR